MKTDLEELFLTRRSKESLLEFANANPHTFDELLLYGLKVDAPNAWRSAWLICHLMKKNDKRIRPHLSILTETLLLKKDGHQRQLLLILLQMELDEETEGLVFDLSMTIWEDVQKIPSTRITAFKLVYKIAEKYPELAAEVELWTDTYYTKTLSPGIKKSLITMKTSLLKSIPTRL
ncbi:hypothetical protein [Flavicella sediminum]|uniref:hypothetical protein n=1 Tax=Flavicella sediminum TaxID=2585141 RepID=UPI001121E2E9|nr:hypothetical protein [Flavicella sediminum]